MTTPFTSIQNDPYLPQMWEEYQRVFNGITYMSFQSKYSLPIFDRDALQNIRQAGVSMTTIPPHPSSFEIHMITVCFHTHTEFDLPKLVQTFHIQQHHSLSPSDPFSGVTIKYLGDCESPPPIKRKSTVKKDDRRGQALRKNQATIHFIYYHNQQRVNISVKVFLNGGIQIAGPKHFNDFYPIITKIESILWACRDAMVSPTQFHITDIRIALINSGFQLGFQFDQEKFKDLIYANEAGMDAIYKTDPAVDLIYVSQYYNVDASNRWGEMAWIPLLENGGLDTDETKWHIQQIGVPTGMYTLSQLTEAVQTTLASLLTTTDDIRTHPLVRCYIEEEGKHTRVWLYARRPFVLFSKRTCDFDRTEPKHRESMWKYLGFQKRKHISQYDTISQWWYIQAEHPINGSEVKVRLFKGRDAEKKGSVSITGHTPYELRDAYQAIQYAFYKYYDQVVFGTPRPYDYFYK